MANIDGRARQPDLDPATLVYLEKVRRATGRISAPGAAPDVSGALGSLRGVAHFDVEVPTQSPRREVQVVKTGVKRLSAWYLRYLSAQLNTFAGYLVEWAEALAATTEALGAELDDVAARVGAVEERLHRLEETGAGQGATAPASPAPAPKRAPQAGAGRPTGDKPSRPHGQGQGRRPPRRRT